MDTKAVPYPDFRDDAHMQAQAAEVGCIPVVADDTTLLLDLDSEAAHMEYRARLARFRTAGLLGDAKETVWNSRSGKGYHVMLTLPSPLPVVERIALQSMLGSDPIRDMLSYSRVKRSVDNPIVLFQPVVQAVAQRGTWQPDAELAAAFSDPDDLTF